MGLIATIGMCVLIGWLAQSWKGRTGAAWFLISAILMGCLFFLSIISLEMHNPELLHKSSGKFAMWLLVNAVGGGIMFLVVATLPNKRRNRAD
jgi:hypothetical protein